MKPMYYIINTIIQILIKKLLFGEQSEQNLNYINFKAYIIGHIFKHIFKAI